MTFQHLIIIKNDINPQSIYLQPYQLFQVLHLQTNNELKKHPTNYTAPLSDLI